MTIETKRYGCGCTATGVAPLPNYCGAYHSAVYGTDTPELRQMVLGDIVDWSDSHSETWQAPRNTGFAAWANNTRTMALIQRCVKAETERDNQLFNVQLLQQQVEDLQRNWVEGWEAGWKASEELIDSRRPHQA